VNEQGDKRLRDELREIDPDIIMYDNLNDAIVGLCARFGQPPILIYDLDRCVDILMNDGGTYEQAIEHFEFNTLGNWAGDYTPAFIKRFSTQALPLDNYIEETKRLLLEMSDKDRLKFIQELTQEYCEYCGDYTPGPNKCNCWNDD